jgi:hypothetical protein
MGMPASAPKHRGNSPGRRKGTKLIPRKRQPALKKGHNPSVLDCRGFVFSFIKVLPYSIPQSSFLKLSKVQ